MADRRVGERPMSQRTFSRVESGTCNVCSAPCSSCMHRKLDELSDENSHGVVGSECSVNEDGPLSSPLVNAHNSLNNTASEASNLVNSSHDPLCENADSKETIRCSGISDDSGAVAMTSETSLSGCRMKHKVSASANVLDQRSNYIDGQEYGTMSDDRAKKLNSADGSALVSDSIQGGSRKDEVNLQSLHNPSSNLEDRVSSERGSFKEKSGPGVKKQREESSVEGSTHSGENRKDGKSSKSDDPISAAVSESESDDSEMVEQDVKVCDICGDAGREDLLAICSRCSDGAEHTYCMQEKLEEVPVGYWLCEDCIEETEKLKQEAKGKRETEATLTTHSSGKRHIDETEEAPGAKRLAVEASTSLPNKSLLPRIGVLSRGTSFKGLDRLRGKLNQQTSFSDDTETGRSTGLQIQPPKGALLKSSSFNRSSLKPKVQLTDDAIHLREKTGKEYTALDSKEGSFRNVGKSMSSRTTDVESSSGNYSQAKMLGSKFYQSKEGNISKQVKDSTKVNVSASSIDPKLKSRGNSSVSHAKNDRELKGFQSHGKRGSLTKQVSNLNRNRQENPIALGRDVSTNERCTASEQPSSQADCKDKLPSTSQTGEGMPSHGTVPLQGEEVGKTIKESFGKRQRSSLLSGAKGLSSSQKVGQTAESSVTPGVSNSDLSTTKNIREDINKGNRLRAAVDAALRKKPSFGKNRGLEQSDTSLVSNVDSRSDKTLQIQLPSKMHKNYVSHEGLQGGHPILWPASDPYKQTIVTNEKQLLLSGADTITPRSVQREVNFPSVKPFMRDLPIVTSPVLLKSSAIPDHEPIWHGDLEVLNTRDQSSMHSGIQAYLSTLASPKVAEVVTKFPEKLNIKEVPRLSTWPAQFKDIGTKEDHIALFFFAKDIESYERNYKPLVDNMIKNDLALKGNIDNVELLIFASNELPSNCQRWNMLYFLWGVFRGRKAICTNPQKNVSLPTSNVLPRDRDPNDPCQTSSPGKLLEKATSLRGSLSDTIHESQGEADALGYELPSNRRSLMERSCNTEEDIALKEDEAGVNLIPRQAMGSNSGDGLVKKIQQNEELESCDRKDLPLTVASSEIQSHGEDNPLEKDLNCNSQATHRKRPLWELTRSANENSSAINQKMELDNDSLHEGSPNKKQEVENRSSSLSREKSDSSIMKKSPKVVFPLDLNVEGDDDELLDNLIPLGRGQNLELALRAEEPTEDTKGLLSFLRGRSSNSGEQSSNSMNKETHKAKGKEEDEADAEASLSLSLSFPSNSW